MSSGSESAAPQPPGPAAPAPRGPLAILANPGCLRALILICLGCAIAFGSSRITPPAGGSDVVPGRIIAQASSWDVVCGVGVGVLLALIGLVAGLAAVVKGTGRAS